MILSENVFRISNRPSAASEIYEICMRFEYKNFVNYLNLIFRCITYYLNFVNHDWRPICICIDRLINMFQTNLSKLRGRHIWDISVFYWWQKRRDEMQWHHREPSWRLTFWQTIRWWTLNQITTFYDRNQISPHFLELGRLQVTPQSKSVHKL